MSCQHSSSRLLLYPRNSSFRMGCVCDKGDFGVSAYLYIYLIMAKLRLLFLLRHNYIQKNKLLRQFRWYFFDGNRQSNLPMLLKLSFAIGISMLHQKCSIKAPLVPLLKTFPLQKLWQPKMNNS